VAMKPTVCASVLALAVLASGCVTRVYVPPPPTVTVQPAPPPMVVQPAPAPPVAQPAPPPAAQPGPAPAYAPAPAPGVVEPAPPPAVVAAPAPMAVTYVPDYYVWDGYEYVGVCGGQYVYWTGGAWLVCDPFIVARFHGWERFHPGWRAGAYRFRRR